jgi:hypothetical protein
MTLLTSTGAELSCIVVSGVDLGAKANSAGDRLAFGSAVEATGSGDANKVEDCDALGDGATVEDCNTVGDAGTLARWACWRAWLTLA